MPETGVILHIMRAAPFLIALLAAPAPMVAADQIPVAGPVAASPATPPALAAPPAAASAADPPIGLGTDMPGRLTVPVTIGADGPYHFTIDTGAERTVISRELAMRLGLQAGPQRRLTAMTGSSDVATVIIPSLTVGTAGAKQIEAPMLSAVNLGAPGLLGIDSLRDHAVTIDFDAGLMTVTPSRKRRTDDTEPGEIVVRARSLLGQLVVTDARYHGRRVRVILDTGSVVTMGNNALRRYAGVRAQGGKPLSLISVTGDTLAANYAQIGDLSVGAVTFRGLPVAFVEAAPFARFGLTEQPAVLLGMDALSQFRRVEIDFANHEVRFVMPRNAT